MLTTEKYRFVEMKKRTMPVSVNSSVPRETRSCKKYEYISNLQKYSFSKEINN